jgi:hypothetical protein
MILLSGPEIARVRHLFGAEQLGFVLDGMIAGNTPSRAWTDDLDGPRTALVWDGGHNVYLAGSVDRPEVWRDTDREPEPAAQASGRFPDQLDQ